MGWKPEYEINRKLREAENPALRTKRLESAKTSQEKNREARKEYMKAYYAANRDRYLAHARRYREEDPEVTRRKDAEQHAKHREKRLQQGRDWYQKNKEKAAAYGKQYFAKNKDLFNAHQSKRRARKNGAGGQYTKQDVQDLLRLQRGCCAICTCRLVKRHVDHVVPLSKGGSNGRENIQLLCQTCNQKKHARDPIEHMQSLGFLI